MEDSYDVSSWSMNGGMALPVFTVTNHETIDSPRAWESSSSQESVRNNEPDVSVLLTHENLCITDLTAMNPMECIYQTHETMDVRYADVETTFEDPEATSEDPDATCEVPDATCEVPERAFEVPEGNFEDPEGNLEERKAISADPEATSKFPSTVKFPGVGGFKMLFDESDKKLHYLSEQNKVFVKDGTNVAIKFAWDWNKKLIAHPKVRAVLLFQSFQMIDTVIKVCPVHKKTAKHVMRCGDNRAEYLKDPETRRRSVLVPLDPPQTGEIATTIVFSFPCRNSCTEVKKNPTQIVFTLEDSLGKVYGRDVLLIQVSSSPMRDMKNAERPNEPKSAKRRPSTSVVADIRQKRVKPEKPIGAMDFMMVPVLNEEHYEQVKLHAHGTLLVHIDKKQRPPTDEEIQLLKLYTSDQTSPQDVASPKNRPKKCDLSTGT